MDSENAAPRLLEFQRLIPDSVGIAMRAADPADFLGWVRERLLNYVVPDFVHVMIEGRIVKSGDKELAQEIRTTVRERLIEEFAE